ncbi:hypothetical protein UA32_12235 [Photobacterium angustum]|uniref:Uncharacterized protein n=1 Tax=Photobacterium angustum TaxID=661 RepID=A0ABX5GZB3_PHOAN|nr:hypothetical protein [Photobacterium angustum]KJG37721.1 hypothetical protein UA32_12235 [Photobacterium angustum]PSX03945.1 hypothetical protein C0W27_20845 [Photobacterium angustum]
MISKILSKAKDISLTEEDKQAYLHDIKLSFDALRNYGICYVLLSAAYYLSLSYSKIGYGLNEYLCVSLGVFGVTLLAANTYWIYAMMLKRVSSVINIISVILFGIVGLSGYLVASDLMPKLNHSDSTIQIQNNEVACKTNK